MSGYRDHSVFDDNEGTDDRYAFESKRATSEHPSDVLRRGGRHYGGYGNLQNGESGDLRGEEAGLDESGAESNVRNGGGLYGDGEFHGGLQESCDGVERGGRRQGSSQKQVGEPSARYSSRRYGPLVPQHAAEYVPEREHVAEHLYAAEYALSSRAWSYWSD